MENDDRLRTGSDIAKAIKQNGNDDTFRDSRLLTAAECESTDPVTFPAVYIDRLECPSVKSGELTLPDDTAYVCGKDSPTAMNGAILCESFCLRGNGSLRIFAGSVATPLTEQDLDLRLKTDILVFTDSGMKEIATVDLGEPYRDHHLSDPLEFAGPEHMFFYRIRMAAGRRGYDPCQTDDLELSLIEGYSGEIHPLK